MWETRYWELNRRPKTPNRSLLNSPLFLKSYIICVPSAKQPKCLNTEQFSFALITCYDICDFHQIVDELREQILKLRFPQRVQSKEATPKTKRKSIGHPSPSKSPSIPAPKPALSDRPCVVVLNKPLEKLLIRSAERQWVDTFLKVLLFKYVTVPKNKVLGTTGCG